MSDNRTATSIRTKIWCEDHETDNRFAVRAAYCRGFDVYGDMLGRARWVDMLYLLFHAEPASVAQADLLEDLAFALANPGPRDASVHAAMCGGVGGSGTAAILMAALAVGAGQHGGGRDVYLAMQGWHACGADPDKWREWLAALPASPGSVWPDPSHAPGFDSHAPRTSVPVRQLLSRLATHGCGWRLSFLAQSLARFEEMTCRGLSMAGVAAAAYSDLGFSPEQGEALHLLLRLPGAAAHALEQRGLGYKTFPFGKMELQDAEGV
ncbi:MAG TPA: citryl-CoA lyase [Noviherbaspirillum sp.]|nr:citryl-CoA lyase [Noviherbaspirillum sp.]